MKRRLALKSEYLAPLTGDELSSVAGGALSGGCLTGYYRTIEAPCPSVQECIYIGQIPTTDCFTGTSLHTVAC